jgi:hypothetical protein
VPYVWHWTDLRARAASCRPDRHRTGRAAMLELKNPGMPTTSPTNTLFAGIQIVMPGRLAQATATPSLRHRSDGGHQRERRADPMLPVIWCSPQLALARPRQRHQPTDDLAGWPRRRWSDSWGGVPRGVPQRQPLSTTGDSRSQVRSRSAATGVGQPPRARRRSCITPGPPRDRRWELGAMGQGARDGLIWSTLTPSMAGR